MSHPLVVHCMRDEYDIYIGRPNPKVKSHDAKWGNPFIIGRDGTREEVIEKYKRWLASQHTLLADLPSLKGKVLGCWCAPQTCHGDVLAELANA